MNRKFSPSSIMLRDEEIAQQIISEAEEVRSLYPKEVYGLALEFALVENREAFQKILNDQTTQRRR